MSLARKVAINVTALSAGRLLNSATGVVAVGFAARYLEPDAYGALIAGIAFTGMFGPIADLGVSTIGARELAKHPEHKRRLLGAVLSVSAFLSVATTVLALIAMFVVYPGGANDLEREAVLLLLLPTLLLPPATTAGTLFIAEQKNYLAMAASVAGSLALLATVALAAELDWGFTGVAAAYAANGVVYALAMTVQLWRQHLGIRPSFDRALCTRILKWAVPLGGGLLVTTLYTRVDVVLLSVLTDREETGDYGLAYKVVDVLMVLPGYMMLTVLPELARAASDRARLDQIVQKAFAVMQTGGIPMLVFMVVFAHEIVVLVGGPEFAPAGPILQILMVGVLISFISRVPWQAMIALNQQRSILMISLYALAVNVALNLALIPWLGGTGAAIGFAATEATSVLFVYYRFRKVATAPRPVNAWAFLLAAGLMASVGLLKLVPGADDVPDPVILVVGGALSLGVYVGVLYLLRAVPPVVHDALVVPVWTKLRLR